MNSLVKTNTALLKTDAYIKIANKLLANIDISFLLFDKDRIKRSIELAINARVFLDPYFQQSELFTVNKEQLLQNILLEFISLTGRITNQKIIVPKNKQDDRTSIYVDLQSYSIRYLLCLILSEKIPISNCVYGGKNEIFNVDSSEHYENEINKFWKLQNEILLTASFSWIVYVDISAYYDSIKNEIIVELLKKKLSLPDDDKFIVLCRKYLQNISIGSFCDNFFQNVYLSDLDSLLQPYSWKYLRLTDDIRVFCNSKEEAELALQIIRQQLEKLDLKVNPSKCFTIKSTTTLEKFKTNNEEYESETVSNILSLDRIMEYPIENVFNLARFSPHYNNGKDGNFIQYKYNIGLPREIRYQDEISQKMGYQIQGTDIKDILDDIENKELLEHDDYKILIKILADAYHTFRVYLRIMHLYVSKLSKEKDVEIASKYFLELISYLSANCAAPIFREEEGRDVSISSDAQLYQSYCFIRVVFIEPYYLQEDKYLDLIKMTQKECWDFFYKVITHNREGNYLSKEIQYIFEKEIFSLQHHKNSNLLKRDDFWNSLIEKEIDDVKFATYIHTHTDNLVYFLDGLFESSSILNNSRAKFYYKRKKYRKALDLFLWIKTNNIHANVDFEIGYCYYDEKLYDKSVFHYTQFLRNNKFSESAFNNRALGYKQLKKYNEALADYSKAIELAHDKIMYYKNKTACLIEMNLPKEALHNLNTAIQLNEQLNKPSVYGADKDYSFEQHNMDVWLYYYRAQVKKIIGDIDGVKSDLQTYCTLEYAFKDKHEDSGYSKREYNRLIKKMLE